MGNFCLMRFFLRKPSFYIFYWFFASTNRKNLVKKLSNLCIMFFGSFHRWHWLFFANLYPTLYDVFLTNWPKKWTFFYFFPFLVGGHLFIWGGVSFQWVGVSVRRKLLCAIWDIFSSFLCTDDEKERNAVQLWENILDPTGLTSIKMTGTRLLDCTFKTGLITLAVCTSLKNTQKISNNSK